MCSSEAGERAEHLLSCQFNRCRGCSHQTWSVNFCNRLLSNLQVFRIWKILINLQVTVWLEIFCFIKNHDNITSSYLLEKKPKISIYDCFRLQKSNILCWLVSCQMFIWLICICINLDNIWEEVLETRFKFLITLLCIL